MKRLSLLFVALFFALSCSKQKEFSTSEVKDITAKKSYAMLIVESESCIYCKQLKKDLQALSSELEGIDVYSILYESNARVKHNIGGKEALNTEEDLARSLKVSSFPHIFFYDREGRVILHIPGYQPPKTLACTIRYVKEERFKQTDYIKYLRSEGCT